MGYTVEQLFNFEHAQGDGAKFSFNGPHFMLKPSLDKENKTWHLNIVHTDRGQQTKRDYSGTYTVTSADELKIVVLRHEVENTNPDFAGIKEDVNLTGTIKRTDPEEPTKLLISFGEGEAHSYSSYLCL